MIDHSLTYKTKSFRNIPHILRLKKILSIVYSFSPKEGESYLDIGCSNGYLTNLIRSEFNFGKTKGLDHTIENLELAKIRYPEIEFEFVDLNVPLSNVRSKYQIITCFETLEHVGNLDCAIENIFSHGNVNSRILISVPIEVGVIGTIKFLVKTLIFNYSLAELPLSPSWWKYCTALLSGQRVSKYRDNREGWGTHFGFDYREVDDLLNLKKIPYQAFNAFSTRFYTIIKIDSAL